MHQTPTTKLKNLKANLKQMQSALIAYSGGTDSAFLIKAAHNTLKNKAIAVTVSSSLLPEKELKEAKDLAKEIGIKHIIIKKEITEKIRKNSGNRCYFCKKEIYKELKKLAEKHKIENILDGTNFDDTKTSRPGIKAVEELKIKTPLKDVKLTKRDIRHLSKKMNLKTHDKPSYSCLATRISEGEEITEEKLKKIEKAENIIRNFGIKDLHVRYKDNAAKIETEKKYVPLINNNPEKIIQEFKKLRFSEVKW